MPLYKWNEVKEKRGPAEQVQKQRDFEPVTHDEVRSSVLEQAVQIQRPAEVDRSVFEKMRAQALHEAESIISDGRSQAEQLTRKAYDEGKSAALQEIQKTFKDNLQKSMDAIQEALDQRSKIIKTAEPDILKLAVKIAMQVIHSEITLNRDVIMNVVADAINKITDREQVIIKVNQTDLDRVKDHKEDIEDMLDGAKNLSIVAEKRVEPGGCIIETKVGLVDARVSTKVEAIESAFMKVYTEDVKKYAVEKGEHVNERELAELRGEEYLEMEKEHEDAEGTHSYKDIDAEESVDDTSARAKTEEPLAEKQETADASFDFGTDDLDLDLDFGDDKS